MVLSGAGGGYEGESFSGTEFQFCKMKTFQQSMVVEVAQRHECT